MGQSTRESRGRSAGWTSSSALLGADTSLSDLSTSNASLFAHRPTGAEPLYLGFECQAVLRERLGDYDYYCYLEDDLILRDPWFFLKLRWFNGHLGDEALLQPNRYEIARSGAAMKAYVDGEIGPMDSHRPIRRILPDDPVRPCAAG